MIDVAIDTTDLVRRLAQINDRELQRAIGVAVAESTRNLIAAYPPPAHKRQPFTSPTQRKAFFAKLKHGAITVPYQRTGDLGRSWMTVPTVDGADLTNARSYADLVHGAKTQA